MRSSMCSAVRMWSWLPQPTPELADTNYACIKDVDLSAKFDGKYLTVEWFSKNQKPPKLNNKIDCTTEGWKEKRRKVGAGCRSMDRG